MLIILLFSVKLDLINGEFYLEIYFYIIWTTVHEKKIIVQNERILNFAVFILEYNVTMYNTTCVTTCVTTCIQSMIVVF